MVFMVIACMVVALMVIDSAVIACVKISCFHNACVKFFGLLMSELHVCTDCLCGDFFSCWLFERLPAW